MKPILFNTEMVRAILEGRKTVTRRVVRGKTWFKVDPQGHNKPALEYAPYRPGDILYVRETWALVPDDGYKYRYCFRANEENIPIERWYPSIHMPKEAARIFLRVTDVRVERLQDCGNMQAKDEGFVCCSQFARIWDSTIKPAELPRYCWVANPYVWVIEFERCEKPERGREL